MITKEEINFYIQWLAVQTRDKSDLGKARARCPAHHPGDPARHVFAVPSFPITLLCDQQGAGQGGISNSTTVGIQTDEI